MIYVVVLVDKWQKNQDNEMAATPPNVKNPYAIQKWKNRNMRYIYSALHSRETQKKRKKESRGPMNAEVNEWW